MNQEQILAEIQNIIAERDEWKLEANQCWNEIIKMNADNKRLLGEAIRLKATLTLIANDRGEMGEGWISTLIRLKTMARKALKEA